MNANKKSEKIRIAIDAMGGDFSPKNEVEGTLLALNSPEGKNLEIIFFGNKAKIEIVLSAANFQNDNRISIVDTKDEVVTMSDNPVESIRTKRASSMFKAIESHKKGETDGFISAGNTGATLAISTTLLGRIEGVSRPTIGTFFPTITNLPAFLTDAGATLERQPRFLYEYAIMGNIYFREIFGVKKPSVGLLNVGEESTKGTEELIETYNMLKNSHLNFIGNIEGRDILTGKVNLVITDGFTGNIVLKFAESFLPVMKESLKQFAETTTLNKLKTGIIAPTLKQILSRFNYEIYGGVPLLGVNGVVIIGHGSSSPTAIKNMILSAVNTIENKICNKIRLALNAHAL